MKELPTYEESLGRMLEQIPEPEPEATLLEHCRGRALADEVCADMDMPPFDKAMMDGFAVRSQDAAKAPAQLAIVGEQPAGAPVRLEVKPGQAIRIMTGAPIPSGADAVQKVEATREREGRVEILQSVSPGQNVSRQGSLVAKGSMVLERGRLIAAPEAGVLAMFGQAAPRVFRGLTARIQSTGSELTPVNELPAAGKIRDSNSHMLAALCQGLGMTCETGPIIPDEPEPTRAALRAARDRDFILLSGGVSMGLYDLVPRILAAEGFEVIFHKAAVKPGKPVLVARRSKCVLFGLPGNPVSCYVTFQLYVRPAVRKRMGFRRFDPLQVRAKLTEEVVQNPGRRFYRPGRIRRNGRHFEVAPVPTKGSADLIAFSSANAMFVMEADCSELAAGAWVETIIFEEKTSEVDSSG
ncbi:MAG TPA: gephyrin-like molybdotransferase Glp [Acidobacteriota bacterium]|nr:gephyrin-like molybdotransferase Glp [Acidobacteriota bacterium]